jgi:hypothetical protein
MKKYSNIDLANEIERDSKSFALLAREYNISRPTVRAYAKRLNLHKGNTKKLKTHTLDIDYFKKIDTENKAYVLTREERLKEKFRAELHSYKKSLEEHADNLHKNSVKYIQEHNKLTEDDLQTMEQRLHQRRHFDDSKKRQFKYEDQVPDQIKPERSHSILSDTQLNRIATIVMRDKLTQENDEDVEERNVFDIKRFEYAPIGRTPILTHGDELQQYFEDMLHEYTPESNGAMEVGDLITDETNPDYEPNFHPRNEIANEFDDDMKEINVFQTLEDNLHNKKMPDNQFDRNNMSSNKEKYGDEDMGVETVYEGSAWFGSHTPASFG